jgi:HNH endonuclease
MESTLFKDAELHQAFEKILSIESFSNCISDIVELIYNNQLTKDSLNEILKEYNIKQVEDIKEDILDLLLVYINLVLNDNVITENEMRNVILLKKFFKITEGDFYNHRYDEVHEILYRQFEHLYADNKIDDEESLYKVELQELFDLSYDQFLEFIDKEVNEALQRGASLNDLDTVYKLPEYSKIIADVAARQISQEVKDLVWNRDTGKCAQCGSNEKLEFDHIIPFSKGGSNTYRNIQLLCEPCNRKKLNKIG